MGELLIDNELFAAPNATAYALEDVVSQVFKGKVRIPKFQRTFRWQWEDVRRLFDSIARGYPIGSLLLWERPAEAATLHLGALEIDAPQGLALWVVDGQQRLTSLASALAENGQNDRRFALAYNLEKQQFQRPPTRPDAHLVPLPTLFDLQKLVRWLAQNSVEGPHFDRATAIAKRIRQYTIPAYIVTQQGEAILRQIFDRMNNYGRRLSRAEVFAALHADEAPTSQALTLSDIAETIDLECGFGRIDNDTVLHAVLARRGPDVTREIRNEFSSDVATAREFANETVTEAYRNGQEALLRAVTFLQKDAHVPHFGFLPYRYPLVVLARFFAHFPAPQPRNRVLLRRWFWRTVLVGPEVAKGWTNAMRTLAAKVVPKDETGSVQQLLSVLDGFPLRPPSAQRFRTNWADTRVLLCAMWKQQPRSLITGQPYDLADLAATLEGQSTAVQAVLAICRPEPEKQLGLAANRIIVLASDKDASEQVNLDLPAKLLDLAKTGAFLGASSESSGEAVLASHCLDLELIHFLSAGDVTGFLAGRQQRIEKSLHDFVEQMAEQKFEDTPPLDSFTREEWEDGDGDGDRDDAG